MTPELEVKQLELLRELLSEARRVAMLRDAKESGERESLAIDMKSAPSLGLTLVPRQIRGLADMEGAFLATAADHDDAVHVEFSGATLIERGRIVEFASRYRLPGIMESDHMPKPAAFSPTVPFTLRTSDAQPLSSTRYCEARNQANFRSKSLRALSL